MWMINIVKQPSSKDVSTPWPPQRTQKHSNIVTLHGNTSLMTLGSIAWTRNTRVGQRRRELARNIITQIRHHVLAEKPPLQGPHLASLLQDPKSIKNQTRYKKKANFPSPATEETSNYGRGEIGYDWHSSRLTTTLQSPPASHTPMML